MTNPAGSPAGQDDPISVAKKYYRAYVDKDRSVIERLIADDFHFTSPLDNRIDRNTYFERCWLNSANTAGFKFVHLVQHGERVFVTYEGRNTSGKSVRNTEILTVRHGKLVDAEVYFGWSLPHPAPAGGFTDAGEQP
jgi:ketosteroid isomerase-like protein